MSQSEAGYSRGPYAKGRERREAILRTTLEVFSHAGSRGASLRAIARELDISPTLLLHYFSSREELLEEVLRAWDDENARRAEGLPFIARWLQAIRHNLEIPGLIRVHTAFAIEATDPDHPSRPFFAARYERVSAALIEDIARQRSLGFVQEDLDLDATARMLIAACEGLQVRWLHEPSFDMYEAFVDLLNRYSILTPEQERERLGRPLRRG